METKTETVTIRPGAIAYVMTMIILSSFACYFITDSLRISQFGEAPDQFDKSLEGTFVALMIFIWFVIFGSILYSANMLPWTKARTQP